MKQRKMRPKRRPGERIIRRASTQRRSQRSVGRSGYAFSHQEGFGELITSGSLQIRKHQKRPGISNVVAPATVDNVEVSPPPYADFVNESFVPSVSDTSVVTSGDLTASNIPASAIDETSVKSTNREPRIPVVV